VVIWSTGWARAGRGVTSHPGPGAMVPGPGSSFRPGPGSASCAGSPWDAPGRAGSRLGWPLGLANQVPAPVG